MAENKVITKIEKSVERLLNEHRKLRERCQNLIAEREALKAKNRALEERVKALEAERAREELTAGLAGTEQNKTRARNRVNRLMREVDKCIALLSSQKRAATNNLDAE